MTNMDLDRLAKLLKARRQELSISASDVARMARISRPYLWVLEGGRNPKTKRPSRPSMEVLTRLALVLELDIGELGKLSGRVAQSAKPQQTPDLSTLERELRLLKRWIRDQKRRESRSPGSEHHELPEHVLTLVDRGSPISSLFRALGPALGNVESFALWNDAPSTVINQAELPGHTYPTPARRFGSFSRDTIRGLLRRGAAQMPLVRGLCFVDVAAGAYVSSVPNPQRVLDYERVCIEDFRTAHETAGVNTRAVVCVYQQKYVDRLGKAGLRRTDVMLSLLASHDRLLHIDRSGGVATDGVALDRALAWFPLRSLTAQDVRGLIQLCRRLPEGGLVV